MKLFAGTSRKLIAIVLLTPVLVGCADPLERIDERVNMLLYDTSAAMNAGDDAPRIDVGAPLPRSVDFVENPASEYVPTTNPRAGELQFTAADNDAAESFTDADVLPDPALAVDPVIVPGVDRETARIIARLDAYDRIPPDAVRLDLPAALAYAFAYSRDYRFAEEEYVLAGLRLLIERHLWGPRFFNDVSANVVAAGSEGTYDSSLNLVNEFRVTQRLPYGGDVAVRALARATEDLHQRVAGENTQSAEILLTADVPLLRGAGLIAREDRIQRERDVIYAAREFERFRRAFVFDVTSDFLQLVVDKQSIANQEIQVESLRDLSEREQSRFEAGKIDLNQAALAEQRFLSARDSLNSQRERYRLAVDRFKVRLGMPAEQPVVVVESSPGLPVPAVSLSEAVREAMTFRLDLQTRRDRIADARRAVDNARNQTLADLDLNASINLPTDPDRDRAGLRFDPEETVFSAGVTYGLPLDREIERINLRQSQIGLERTLRDYDEFVDSLAVTVRSVVRDIDRARYSLEIQEKGIENAQSRLESFESAPGRFTARDVSEAVQDLNRARNDYDSAYRDLQLAILRYLLESGQLRINDQGFIRELDGMNIQPVIGSPRDRLQRQP